MIQNLCDFQFSQTATDTMTWLLKALWSLLLVYRTASESYDCFEDASWAIMSPNVSSLLGEHRRETYQDFQSHCLANTEENCRVAEEFRLYMNRYQPQSVTNYTKTGFLKTKVPEAVRGILQRFWETNKDQAIQEKTAAAYHNKFASVPSFVNVANASLPGGGIALQANIANAVRETVEAWTGLSLTWTSVYGIRIYHNNSILTPHVDRLPLVCSVIVHIENDLDEDWVLEVFDHDGKAHNISMEPWDMVLYESHSVIHGRPFAMRGRYYANLFAHFEPLPDTLDVELPPYLIPGSVWEAEWRDKNPDGYSFDVVQAVRKGDLKAIQHLAKVAPETLTKRDNNGWQPLHDAVRFGDKAIVQYLIEEAGISPFTLTKNEETPLVLAKYFHPKTHEVVQYLSTIRRLEEPDL